jgi:hypothetical protein
MLPGAMEGGALKARGICLLAAMLAALFAIGCGSSGSDEVEVQTGSLSKAAFIAKADSICETARGEFLAKFTSFAKTHQSELSDSSKQEAAFGEVLETLLAPNIERQIEQIRKLGAPSDYAPEVATFLNALQERLDEASENPVGLTKTPYPFKEAEDLARKAGMNGCAESFS